MVILWLKKSFPLVASLGLHLSVMGMVLFALSGGGAGNSTGQGTGMEGQGAVLLAELVALPSSALHVPPFNAVETVAEEVTPLPPDVQPPALQTGTTQTEAPSRPEPAPSLPEITALPVLKNAEAPPKQPSPKHTAHTASKPAKQKNTAPPPPQPPPTQGSASPGSSPGMEPLAGATGQGTLTLNRHEGAGNGPLSGNVDVDAKPRITKRAKVEYPEAARRKKLTGQVVVRFHLDENGTISRLAVTQAEPAGIFDEAAVAAVKKWKFSPATKDGKPVPYWVELPIHFSLKQ